MTRAVLVSALLFTLSGVSIAAGVAATADEVAVLAERAIDDPTARDDLREITEVDGTPVDFGPLLDGSESEVLGRLRTLASQGDGPIDVSGASRDAEEILSEKRFAGVEVATRDSASGRATSWLSDHIPQPIKTILGSWGFWVIAGVIIVGLTLAKTMWSRNPSWRYSSEEEFPGGGSAVAPMEFERMADRAEAAGDYDAAIRLRFRAGLVRLRGMGTIDDENTTSAGRLRRLVPIPAVERLAGTFEWIAYGDRPASSEDVEQSRSDWVAVLQAAGGSDA